MLTLTLQTSAFGMRIPESRVGVSNKPVAVVNYGYNSVTATLHVHLAVVEFEISMNLPNC
jgi:hypothetical protein